MRQDLAVVVTRRSRPAEVVAVRARGRRPLLRRVEVFDVYRGEQIGEGEVSLALRLEFRSPERTLTDEEVAERARRIEAALARASSGGTLRA